MWMFEIGQVLRLLVATNRHVVNLTVVIEINFDEVGKLNLMDLFMNELSLIEIIIIEFIMM